MSEKSLAVLYSALRAARLCHAELGGLAVADRKDETAQAAAQAEVDKWGNAIIDAQWAMLDVEPTTIVGMIASLDYVTEFSGNGYREWPPRFEEDECGRHVSFEDDAMRFASQSLKRILAGGGNSV